MQLYIRMNQGDITSKHESKGIIYHDDGRGRVSNEKGGTGEVDEVGPEGSTLTCIPLLQL